MTAARDSEIDLDQYTGLPASYQFHCWASSYTIRKAE
jgi:hypothetical protein